MTSSSNQPFGRNVYLLLALWACTGFSYGGLHVVLFNLYLIRLGYGPEFVGTANSVIVLSLALFSFPAGWLGRRFGCRRMLIIGMGLAILYVLVPIADNIPSQLRPFVILATVAVFGCAPAIVIVAIQPFLMASTVPEQRNRAFSMQTAMSPLFGFGGSLVGGFLPGKLAVSLGLTLDASRAYGLSLLLVPVVFALGFILLHFTHDVEEAPTRKKAARADKAPIRIILGLSLINLLVMASLRSTQLFFNIYMDARFHAPTSLIGATIAVATLLSAPSALLMPIVAKKIGRSMTLVAAIGLLCLSQLLLALVPHWAVAGLSLAGVLAVLAVFRAAFVVHSQELVSHEWRPIMAGTVTAARGVGTSALLFGGGYLISGLGHRPLFILNAIIALAAAIIFLFARSLWPAGDQKPLRRRSS